MQKELIKFIVENNLSPFNKNRTEIRNKIESIFRTKDARAVHTKTIGKIGEGFIFTDTINLINFFSFTEDIEEISRRQEFFRKIGKNLDNSFLKGIKKPERTWKPKYGIVAVTEDEKTLLELKKMDVPVKFISSSEDVEGLDNYDLIQVIDCDESKIALERLNQTIFIKNIDDIYLERYLELASGWKNILDLLEDKETTTEVKDIVNHMKEILKLIDEKELNKITREEVEERLEEINENLSERMKTVSISGKEIFEMMSKGILSEQIANIIEEEIEKSGISEEIFIKAMPVTIDEKELNKILREQDSNEFVKFAERIKARSNELKEIPEKLRQLENFLILLDFYAGVSKFIQDDNFFHENSGDFIIYNSRNLFLDKPQAISFSLDEKNRCSILTGANSGGKTTLLEHIIQLISLFQIGLPVSGNVKIPLFSEIYYFAKNKGSMSKGAFETLLTQMSEIKPKNGNKTLILADEIESVTEPGVAGKIICATAEYFIKSGCFLIIATHLGKEIQANLPVGARIDGIEAKGLDENYELIVDHNPVLGKLAHSTPELIIEKMAKTNETKSDYINYIFSWMKK